MSVIDKMKKITDSLENKNDNENFNKNSSTGTFKNIFINYIEEHKGVRRIILFVILWINVHIFLVSVNMYKTNLFLDQQWVIFAGYWVGILTTIVAFYTTGRNGSLSLIITLNFMMKMTAIIEKTDIK